MSENAESKNTVHSTALTECGKQSSATERSDSLLCALDSLEKRVESLRNQAIYLENEREVVLRNLHDLQFDPGLYSLSEGAREDIMVNSERLICRCLTVEVDVRTIRDKQQEEALSKVHSYINNLESQIKSQLDESFSNLTLLLNACLSTDGPVHSDFQKALLSCTADDQKKVKSKLQLWEKSLKQMKGRFSAV